MDGCFVLKDCNLSKVRHVKWHLKFKYQSIFNPKYNCKLKNLEYKKNIVGAELLIDFQHMKALGISEEDVNSLILLGEAVERSLDCLEAFISFGNQYVFLNVERVNLCDVKVLKRLVDLSSQLSLMGITLVVEITERAPCGRCGRILEGLIHLKNRGVILAIDDFNYIEHEVDICDVVLQQVCEFVKVEMPLNQDDFLAFERFVDANYKEKKIIVERVETEKQIKSLNVDKLWGVQGFAYCKGVALPRTPFI